MASRTRERLIDVARQLFVHKGLENTTMSDIATASDRGRRTIYTYFRTKDDIYQAVIEEEASRILDEIDTGLEREQTPASKLKALFQYFVRMSVEDPGGHEVWFKSLFVNRDMKRAQSVRQTVTSRLYEVADEIVSDGIDSGDFRPEQARRIPSMLKMIIRAGDTSVVRDSDAGRTAEWLNECIDFIIGGVTEK